MRFCHGMSLEKTMTELFDKRKGKFQNLRKNRETHRQTKAVEKYGNRRSPQDTTA